MLDCNKERQEYCNRNQGKCWALHNRERERERERERGRLGDVEEIKQMFTRKGKSK